jgi:hypothetical protein
MIIIMDNNSCDELGKFNIGHFIETPQVNDEIEILKKGTYKVISRVHNQKDQSRFSNVNKFDLILYVEKI